MTEIELKLLVPGRELGAIFELDAVKRRARGAPAEKRLVSVYYDTPEGDLRAHRIALRLRQDGARWVQTLKGGGIASAGLHQRDEFEWQVPSRRLDLGVLASTRYAQLFAKQRIARALRPVFTTRFLRVVQPLQFDDGTTTELCADSGTIRAGPKREPISEIEIELVTGDPLRLFELSHELEGKISFRLGHLSKAERGYALFDGELSRPQKAGSIVIERTAPALAALRKIATASLAQIQANEAGFLSGSDPEFLHQMRVGLRRLRVALGMPDDPAWRKVLEPLRAELRWLSSVLGPARNWDVYLTEILPPLARHFAGSSALAAFRSRCRRLRRRHVAAARDAVFSSRYTNLLLELGALLARESWPGVPGLGAAEFAQAVVARRDRKLRRRLDDLARAAPEERHRARIAAKKLRYCAEFFASLYTKRKVKRYVDALSELQDALGAINDAQAGAQMTEQAAMGARTRADPRIVGMVLGWMAANDARAIAALGRVCGEFAKQKSFWV
ncbi:MAG: CYTH and CHAD domain-containing protein [Betaproteobacteria bacterium]|nr:CYTH and CHAD domain-containing protein [Betaproteobacteria bacterium]